MTPELAVWMVIAFVAGLLAIAGMVALFRGPDPDLAAPWSPDDREPPCRCGMRVHPSRHRYHESSRWQERGERGL